MADMDMDTDNYSVPDLLTIFNIVEPTVFNVTDVANDLIAKMKTDGNPAMMDFFSAARDKLLAYLQMQRQQPVVNETTVPIEQNWQTTNFIDANPVNPTRYFTDEAGSHIVADKNPTVSTGPPPEPIISTHLLIIDSQFRSNILPYKASPQSNAFNTQFTFNLTNQITKAISLKLYSYVIPTSWNSFNAQAGNTFFLYNGVIIIVPDGNYTPQTLVAAINVSAQQNAATAGLLVAYNAVTNRISLLNTDPLLGVVTIIFFINSNSVNYTNCGAFVLQNYQTLSINSTLGWLLGFRTSPDPFTGDVVLFLEPTVLTYADVAADTYGPKYFTLGIEDYSNQRLSNGLYNITNSKVYTQLSMPDYYNTIYGACKFREGSLTQAQIYSINAIANPNSNNLDATSGNTLIGPTASTTFAVIPLQNIRTLRPDPYIKFGADLFVYKRSYIRPTHLERFTVTLTDDKGNLVNLYDNDWSFSLIVEERLN
jgi:hypothetical protein